MLGRLLAQEHPWTPDIVVPVPDSGVPAAVGYALESKIPFRMGLIRITTSDAPLSSRRKPSVISA